MKKGILKLVAAVIAASLFSGTALAAEEWASSNLKFVYPLSNGGFVLGFVTSPAGCMNAGNPKYLYVVAGENGVTAEGAKAMLATALSGYLAGKRIQAAFDNSTSSCYINRLLVTD